MKSLVKRAEKIMSLQDRKGQLRLGDAPGVVLIILFLFMVMAVSAFVSQEFGDALPANSTAQNVTVDLNKEIADNTSIAGIVLTISLIGIVLTTLIGLFLVFTERGPRI